jgi:pyruvate/2-oxoglutarate dehydrogenase complex dihydrolipoamide dehydrogenase (E3) component
MFMFDVVIIGGGPAGVTAALRARELGASVAIVERYTLGGTCTNDGCVPTRVLAKAARLMRDTQQFADYGLFLAERPTVDFGRVLQRTQQVVYEMHEKKQLLSHLDEVGIEVYSQVGNATFVDPHTILLEDGRTIEGQKFVLCVGGSPRRLPFPGGEYALTHSDVWTLDHLPKTVAIVGTGATGCQLASIFEAFGSQVTLLELAPRILLSEDELIADTIAQEFTKHGMAVMTGIDGIERIERRDGLNHLNYKDRGEIKTLAVEAIILAVGWPGNLDALNLAAAGVEVNRNYIQVDDYLQTSASHIFAAGDITGRMMLVQSASYQARVAVENALLDTSQVAQHRLVPHGGFTDPEYGGVGYTEVQAREKYDCAVAVVPYADLDRAVIDGQPVGFCKLIVDRQTHLVLGAHVVGEQAVEVVSMVSAGMAGGLRVEQLADLEIAYPTFAAVVGLAARQLVRDLRIVPVVPEWRALHQVRGAEWERLD